jgi:hypothetical protein
MTNKFCSFAASLAVLTLSVLLAGSAEAAPHPGTATSSLVSPQLGIYRSPLGFKVGSGTSGWAQAEPPKDNKFIATMYKAPMDPKNPQAEAGSLTVRIDQLDREMALEKYVQRWMKEYPKYGFDVLGSTAFAQNKQKGYVLDLINRDSGRQLRQVVFVKKQAAVILTCRDQVAKFKDALKSCNQIIRTFEW